LRLENKKSEFDRLQVIGIQEFSNYNAANMLEKVSQSRIIQRLRQA